MFDAKSLIEMMMKGAAGQAPQAPPPQQGGLGGLGDLLGKMMQGGGQSASQSQGGGLGDLLGKLGGAAQQGRQAAPAQNHADAGGLGGLSDLLGKLGGGAPQGGQGGHPPQSGGLGGGLEDMLRKLGGAQGGGGGQGAQGAGGGGLMDILGQVLGQATSGVKEGAQRMDDATGASSRMKQATGQDPGQMMEQLKELVRQNQLGAGAAAGGLGALVLGTKTGRSVAGRAMKIGGLALIGGLAYKALQNYQSGKPLISGASEIAAAPSGTGFETAAVTQDSALLYIRSMISAAAADGRIDEKEQQKLMGNLQQLGINAEAEEFLARELNSPASAEQLAQACKSQEEAVQVFTAARLAVDLDTEEEHAFLVQLAGALGLEGDLVAHIDAAARAA
jgi:uncharacterized membrane protein YebE (DUF533 family)